MDRGDKLKEAREIGKDAHRNKLPAVPTYDKNLMNFIKVNADGSTSANDLLKEWQGGWFSEEIKDKKP